MVIGHLIIVTEDSGYNKDGNLVTEDSMNCSVYNVHQKPNIRSLLSSKKRKVNFSLTLDMDTKQEKASDDACVPQGVEVSGVDSYYSDLPTTPHVSEFQLFSDIVATYNRDFQVSHWEIYLLDIGYHSLHFSRLTCAL